MVLRYWSPFTEFFRFGREIDILSRDKMGPGWVSQPARAIDRRVDLDVYHRNDALVIKAAIPGVKPEEIEISVTENVLTIEGEVHTDPDVDEDKLVHTERLYGSFRREVLLTEDLNSDESEASYESGVLTITIPKEEEVKPKSLKIKVTGH